MADKIELHMFDKHIGDIYKENDHIIMKQYENRVHLASPLMIPKDQEYFDSTALTFIDRVPGLISDSLPGSYGDTILNDFFEHNNNGKSPSVIDKLHFIGDRGLGALTFSPSNNPSKDEIETLNLKTMFEKARDLKHNKSFSSLHEALLVSAHSFVGGARAKAVASINLESKEVYLGNRNDVVPEGFIPAIIKYDDTEEGGKDKSLYSKLEYIYYLLAKESGIEMSDCYLLNAENRHHFVAKRFDYTDGKRFHVHSLAGLLHKDYNIPMSLSYEELFETARRLNASQSNKQLFKQMIFNFLYVNQDDHSRNFSFMCDDDFQWKATPAYDITFAKGKKQTIEHQLSLYGKPLSKIGIEEIVRLGNKYELNNEFMAETIEEMIDLRESKLGTYLKEYDISTEKRKQLIHEESKRNFD
jgi:serine/threonine-protein kinase HipA